MIEAERRAAEARERALRIKHSFTIAAEAFIADKLKKERSGDVAERDLRKIFIAAWAERPVSEITKLDVLEILLTRKRTAPQMARALLVLIKRFFGWWSIRKSMACPPRHARGCRERSSFGEIAVAGSSSTDTEIFAFWRATGRMGYPAGSVYRLLLLTGLRLNEAAQISWPEIQGNIIVIPASRMKGKEGKAREHLVPLSSGDAGNHRIGAAHQERAVPILFKRWQAATDDDRADEGRSGSAHGKDA